MRSESLLACLLTVLLQVVLDILVFLFVCLSVCLCLSLSVCLCLFFFAANNQLITGLCKLIINRLNMKNHYKNCTNNCLIN